jgi:hypothetical protein
MNDTIDNNDTAYVITSGEYSDYAIHSVWTDKAKAEELVVLLNKQDRWVEYGVEEFGLNKLNGRKEIIWKGTYDCKVNGYSVDVNNIVMEKIVDYTNGFRGYNIAGEVITAVAYSEDYVRKSIFDAAAKAAAQKEGL